MPEGGRKGDRRIVEGPWLLPEDERILELLAAEHTAREIADELGVSLSVARRKIESAIAKLERRRFSAPPSDV
jgi:DNA-binding CsgD family transcriptional regulator